MLKYYNKYFKFAEKKAKKEGKKLSKTGLKTEWIQEFVKTEKLNSTDNIGLSANTTVTDSAIIDGLNVIVGALYSINQDYSAYF